MSSIGQTHFFGSELQQVAIHRSKSPSRLRAEMNKTLGNLYHDPEYHNFIVEVKFDSHQVGTGTIMEGYIVYVARKK